MPGTGNASLKLEPPSDEEDSNPQLPDIFLSNRFPEYHSLTSTNVDGSCHNADGLPSMLHHLQSPEGLEELAPLAPAGPAATPVCVKQERAEPPAPALDLETLKAAPHATGSLLERHIALLRSSEVADSAYFTPLLPVKDEPSSEGEQQPLSSDELSDAQTTRGSPKSWTHRDMQHALDALRNHNMSLTKASATYGIPSTTLWQRAHRLGIDTPKKEGTAKSWSEEDLRGALHALRAGAISANKASKAYGIPSSTLYKIARREGIRLAAPFNAAPVAWRRPDLQRALAAIRAGRASVQRAASQYGIPTGTLYGRCKREGIELSRSNPTPWSEGAMGEALEAVKVGQMSINQAAIHYNLPYSSLYGRFKRCKYQAQPVPQQDVQNPPEMHQELYYQQMPVYPEQDHSVPHHSQPYPAEFAQDPHSIPQDPYSGQAMYYQNFSSIATS